MTTSGNGSGGSPIDVRPYQWGYRPKVPRRPDWFTQWPEGARIAVNVTVLHEWESVPRPTRPMPEHAVSRLDFLSLGIREYGARHGIYRLLDLMDRHQLKATILVSGLLATLFPESVREAHQRGHEIAVHGWDQAVHAPVFKTKEEERDALEKTIAAIQAATGERPRGFMSQGPRPSANTLQLSTELGFVWTGDYGDSDFPYMIDVNGKKIVSVGFVFPAHTDNDLFRLGLDASLKQALAEFDAVYAEADRHPMQYRYAAHVHVSGRPGMAGVLDQFLIHVRNHPGVWFCRSIDIANYWLAHEGQGTTTG